MFRDDVETLAKDLSEFIHQVVLGDGYKIHGDIIKINPDEGSPTDLSILLSSPNERASKKGSPTIYEKNSKYQSSTHVARV